MAYPKDFEIGSVKPSASPHGRENPQPIPILEYRCQLRPPVVNENELGVITGNTQ